MPPRRPPRDKPTALDLALRLLAARARTSVELLRALARAGVGIEERAEALARVRELGYMDDREVASARAERRIERGEGPRLVSRRLRSEGIPPSLAEEAVSAAAGGASDAELVSGALRRKLRGRAVGSEGERRRLFRALVAKGHRPRLVAEQLGLAWEGDDEDEDEGDP